MSRYLFMIALAVIISAGAAYAARCYRPSNIPACPTPAPVPNCRTTNEAANAVSCYLCHDYLWRHA